MTFETECPHCQRSIRAKPEHLGKTLACPGCNQRFQLAQSAVDGASCEYGMTDPLPSVPSFGGQASDPLGDPFLPAHLRPSRHAGNLPETRSYPALNVVRTMLLVLAALVALSWLTLVTITLGGALLAASHSTDGAVGAAGLSLIYLIPAFLGSAITICFLIAASELIRVILDIQSNTLAAARR